MAEDCAFYGGGEWAVVLFWVDHGVLFLGRAGGGCIHGPRDIQKLIRDSDDGCRNGVWKKDGDEKWEDQKCPMLTLDDARYHSVDSQEVPNGYARVPVTVNDNGYEFPAVMVAGSVGIGCGSREGGGMGLDTVQAESGWWMFERKSEERVAVEKKAEDKARRREYAGRYVGWGRM